MGDPARAGNLVRGSSPQMLIAVARHLQTVRDELPCLTTGVIRAGTGLIPTRSPPMGTVDLVTSGTRRRRVLGGLVNEYDRAALRSPADQKLQFRSPGHNSGTPQPCGGIFSTGC